MALSVNSPRTSKTINNVYVIDSIMKIDRRHSLTNWLIKNIFWCEQKINETQKIAHQHQEQWDVKLNYTIIYNNWLPIDNFDKIENYLQVV